MEGVAKTFSKQLPRSGGLAAVGRVALCLDWFTLLWRGWLKIFQNSSQGGGSLAAVGRVALCLDWFTLLWRRWLKFFQNNSQWGWGPCFGGGLCYSHNHNTGNIKCDCKTINTCHSEFNDDDYTDITTYSIANGTGTCIIPNRSHNHVNIDSDYIITITSVHI